MHGTPPGNLLRDRLVGWSSANLLLAADERLLPSARWVEMQLCLLGRVSKKVWFVWWWVFFLGLFSREFF